MKPVVELLFDWKQSFSFCSGVYAGLDQLARRGAIRFQLRLPRAAERDLTEHGDVLCLWVQSSDRRPPRLLALDLHDTSTLFVRRVLERCDVYLKRSLFRPDLAGLPPELARKVQPFGLLYACRTFSSAVRLLCVALPRLVLRGRQGLKKLYGFLTVPGIGEFEQAPDAPLEPTISFQTRIWDAASTGPGEHEIINGQRVALIRALKETFGDRFRGGLVPTPLARARYPRELSPFPSRRRLYTAMNRKSLIGIYSRGLHQSTAFKLAESLAAAQCVVAEPPRNELPIPLAADKHFLPFASVEECITACQRLLADNDLAHAMRVANHSYYRAEVEPSAHCRRIFERHAELQLP